MSASSVVLPIAVSQSTSQPLMSRAGKAVRKTSPRPVIWRPGSPQPNASSWFWVIGASCFRGSFLAHPGLLAGGLWIVARAWPENQSFPEGPRWLGGRTAGRWFLLGGGQSLLDKGPNHFRLCAWESGHTCCCCCWGRLRANYVESMTPAFVSLTGSASSPQYTTEWLWKNFRDAIQETEGSPVLD